MDDLTSRLFDRALPRALDLPERIWLRLTSPSGMRLLAPLLGLLLVYLGWRLWRAAGRGPLGRAARWWGVALVLAVFGAGLVYGAAAPPADPDVRAVQREQADSLLHHTPLPAPLAAAGAVAVAGAGLAAAWRWRAAHLRPADAAALGVAWRGAARRARWPLALGGVLLLGAGMAAGAALFVAGSAPAQVPEPGALGPPGATLWVGTPSGLNRLRQGGGARGWEVFARPGAPLPANQVTALAAGRNGEMWIATHGGLARYREDGAGGEWRTATVESAGLPYPTVLGLAVDSQGVAWAATGAGGAMVYLEARTSRGGGRAFTGVNAPLMHQILDAVFVDRQGQVWFGSAGGVNVYRPDAGGGPGTWPTGFNRPSTRGGLPDNQVYTIFGDRRGRIWFGTGGGVAALSVSPDDFGLGAYEPGRWTTHSRPTAPLAGDAVHAIAEDGRGRLYFGTAAGITVLDESESDPARRWRQLGAGPAGGLPDPAVHALAVAPDGRLWAGTAGGLAVLDPERPDAGWQTFRAHPLRRWLALLPDRPGNRILADDVTALAFTR